MKIDVLKGTSLLITSLLTTTILADDSLDTRVGQLEQKMSQVRTQTALGAYGAQTASARPQNDGWGLFFTANMVLWKVYEGGAYDVGSTTANATEILFGGISPGMSRQIPESTRLNLTSTTNDVQQDYKNVEFDWDFGFKLGLGYKLPYDGWDIYANYTQFITEGDQNLSNPAPSAANRTFGPATAQFFTGFTSETLADSATTTANAHWTLHFYDINLLAGRDYFISKYFSAKPYFGLKSTWIRQKIKTKTVLDSTHLLLISATGFSDKIRGPAITTTTQKGKNNFWGIGPTIGFDGNWFFNRYVGLYGGVSGAILWGDFDISLQQTTNQITLLRLHPDVGPRTLTTATANTSLLSKANPDHFAPMVHFEVGFEGSFPINNNRFNCALRVGYESQYWWRQNFLNNNNFVSPEDLGIHGLDVQVRFDF